MYETQKEKVYKTNQINNRIFRKTKEKKQQQQKEWKNKE